MRGVWRGRAVAAGALLACAAVFLTGCQTAPEAVENDGPGCAPGGVASGSIRAEGDLFTRPEVTFPAPLSPLTTERTVLTAGEGTEITLGAVVTVEFVAFNGASGEPLEASGYGTPGIGHTILTLDSDTAMPGLRRALLCSNVGSRVAAVVHPQDGIGEIGAGLGIGGDDPIVYVFDIVSVAGEFADGEPQPQVEGLPIVESSDIGRPSVSVPVTAPPTDLVASTVLLGTGPVVRDGSDVHIRYRGVLWRNGLTVVENWSEPRPTRLAFSDMLPGVAQALIGRNVGSRVLAVVPPQLGFGLEGDLTTSVTGSDTLVFVIDILATT